jgi:hypothetical protein
MKVVLILLTLVMSGCISPQTYVAPGGSSVAYDNLKTPAKRYQVIVDVEFLRNGEAHPAANRELRSHVEQTLLTSGVFTVVADGTRNRIKVLVNNIGDLDDARAKGFKAGLTLGAAGSLIVDAYEFTIEFHDGADNDFHKTYRHELHTAIGNVDPPFEDIQPTTPARGFALVVEQAILNFIGAMQGEGYLGQRIIDGAWLISSTMCLPLEKQS